MKDIEEKYKRKFYIRTILYLGFGIFFLYYGLYKFTSDRVPGLAIFQKTREIVVDNGSNFIALGAILFIGFIFRIITKKKQLKFESEIDRHYDDLNNNIFHRAKNYYKNRKKRKHNTS